MLWELLDDLRRLRCALRLLASTSGVAAGTGTHAVGGGITFVEAPALQRPRGSVSGMRAAGGTGGRDIWRDGEGARCAAWPWGLRRDVDG